MRPDAGKAAAALEEWVRLEVSETSKRYYDLGKFLFSVASATLVALAGLFKLSGDPFGGLVAGAVVLHFTSFLVSGFMLVPRAWRLGPHSEIEREIAATTRNAQILSTLWFTLWGTGVAMGFVALFS